MANRILPPRHRLASAAAIVEGARYRRFQTNAAMLFAGW